MVNKSDKKGQSHLSFNIILKTYFKSNKRKLIISLLFTILSFIFVSTLFLCWFSYQNISFKKHSSEINWYANDQLASYSVYQKNRLDNFSLSYLDNAIENINTTYNDFIPGIVNKISGTIEVILRGYNPLYSNILADFTLKTFDKYTSSAITNSYLNGRFPENNSELLLYQPPGETTNQYYNINDTISLKPDLPSVEFQNFTISGELINFDDTIELVGYSRDLILNFPIDEKFGDYPSISTNLQTFIVSQNQLFMILNNYTDFTGLIGFACDITYDMSKLNFLNEKEYRIKLSEWMEGLSLSFDTEVSLKIGADLLLLIDQFKQENQLEIIEISSIGVIILFQFVLLSFEMLNYDKDKMVNIFRLMKIQGLDKKSINKLILIESITVLAISLISGIIIGLIFSYMINLILHWQIPFTIFIVSLFKPILIIGLVAIFLLLLVLNLSMKVYYANKSKIDLSEKMRNRYSKRFSWFMNNFELMFILFGGIFLGFSIPSLIFVNRISSDGLASNIIILTGLLSSFIFLGSFLLVTALLFLLARLISFTWSKFGNYLWVKKRNFFTLSFMNISKDYKEYYRFITSVLLIGFCLLPGFILNTSINKHLTLNSDLAVGYSDLLINSWNSNQTLRDEIESVSGIVFTSESTLVKFKSNNYISRDIVFSILALNITNFIQTTNINKLGFSSQEIASLNDNRTCFINHFFARKFGLLDNNAKLTINSYWDYAGDLKLTILNSFESFPLMQNDNEIFEDTIFDFTPNMKIVLNKQTFSDIISNSYGITLLSEKNQLMIKVVEGANISAIKSELNDKFSLLALSSQEIYSNSKYFLSTFQLGLIILSSIISILTLFFSSFILAQNIFQRRSRNIESDFRLGASKKQLILSYTFEFLFISFLPIIISLFIGGIAIHFLQLILNIDQSYIMFKPWLSWWVILLIFILTISISILGWWINVKSNIRKYQPIKQE
ncbi:MAG: hypothetical protein JXA54_11480 [Candidatus Heimdallarchaeota archaeon]|nr:hypothetical protein [Candidatus Heimdallarchaeota archaeon]